MDFGGDFSVKKNYRSSLDTFYGWRMGFDGHIEKGT
jgi:hypothetical protein